MPFYNNWKHYDQYAKPENPQARYAITYIYEEISLPRPQSSQQHWKLHHSCIKAN